jgi:hypothetical protein
VIRETEGLPKSDPRRIPNQNIKTDAASLPGVRYQPGKSGATDALPPIFGTDVPRDPWGNAYHYRSPGIHNPDTVDVWTVGPDGKEIGNWK